MKRANLLSAKLQCFSLLEMAIVISVMGLISGTVIQTVINHINYTKVRRSELNKKKVIDALIAYIKHEGILPFPSNPKNREKFGHSPELGSSLDATIVLNNYCGVVPYITIGLTEEEAKNGYQNFFTLIIRYNGVYTDKMLRAVDHWDKKKQLYCGLTSINYSYLPEENCTIVNSQGKVLWERRTDNNVIHIDKAEGDAIIIVIVDHGNDRNAAPAQDKETLIYDSFDAVSDLNSPVILFQSERYKLKIQEKVKGKVTWLTRSYLNYVLNIDCAGVKELPGKHLDDFNRQKKEAYRTAYRNYN